MTDFPISALPAMTEILGTESLVGVQTSTKKLPISVLVAYLGSATAGVASFNGRTGIVTQTSLDITTALGYTPTSVIGLTGALSAASFKTGLSLTKSDVGLGSVDNTSDAGKPVSTAQQTALDLKADLSLRGSDTVFGLVKVDGTTITATGGVLTAVGGGSGVSTFNTRSGAVTLTSGDVTGALGYTPTSVTGLTGTQSVAAFKTGLSLVKADVGLGSVDNTADSAKPVSTAQQTALDLKQNLDATLTALAGVTTAADKVIYATGVDTFSTADFGSVARTLVAQTSQSAMRTTGLGMTANGSSLVAAADYAAMKVLLSLNNVDNTSDANKPVSTAQAAADALAVPKAGGTMTGPLILAASAVGTASFRIPHGTAPSAPTNGDIWTTSAGLYARINGATVGPYGTGGGGGSGDVVGPAVATDGGFAKFDTTTGKLLKDSPAVIAVADGGTNLTSYTAGDLIYASGTTAFSKLAAAAANNVLLSGTSPSWGKVALGSAVSGTLPIANGGTGITAFGTGIATALGVNIGSAGAPVLFNGAGGTPSSLTLTNAAGLPLGSITGFGTSVATALAIAIGTAGSPVLNGGALGTPSSGNLSNCTVDGTNLIGFRGLPQNSKSANYTCVLGDAGGHIFHPAGDANNRTFTIPANSSVAYPIGTTLTFVNKVNTVTIAITTDTLTFSPGGSTGSRSLAANGMATAVKITSTEWLISGTGLS